METILAKEFLTKTFTIDWMTSEEIDTIATAMELYAKGKCKEQRMLCSDVVDKHPMLRKSELDVELGYKVLHAPEPKFDLPESIKP